MRKIIAIIIIFISLVVNAQGANRFSEAEDAAINYSTESSSQARPAGPDNGNGGMRDQPDCDGDGTPDDQDEDECAPNPGDPVPIDDYLPLLMVAAVGMIGYAGYRKRKLTA